MKIKLVFLNIFFLAIINGNAFSLDLREGNELTKELEYWKNLFDEDLISELDYKNKQTEAFKLLSIIYAKDNIELEKNLTDWNLFFENLFKEKLIAEEEYIKKLNSSTKYIKTKYKIKTRDDLTLQLKFWKTMLEKRIINEIQYLYLKDELLKLKLIEISEEKRTKISKLESFYNSGLITKNEFEIKRREILDDTKKPNNIHKYGCIKNYTNKLNKKNINKVMCFCINSSTFNVSYVIQFPDQINQCQNKRQIPYSYYLQKGGHEFHNAKSFGVGSTINLKAEDIELWNKQRKKIIVKKRIKNDRIKRSLRTNRIKRSLRTIRNRCSGWRKDEDGNMNRECQNY